MRKLKEGHVEGYEYGKTGFPEPLQDNQKQWPNEEVIDLLEWIQNTANIATDRFLMSKMSAKSLLEIYHNK